MSVEEAVASDQQLGSCWECGYSLRGLTSNRCPECGRAFDPNDKTTMNMGREVGALAKWLMKPPGWPVHLLTGAAVLVSLWAAVVPTPRGAFADLFMQSAYNFSRSWAFDWIGRSWMQLDQPQGRFLLGASAWVVVAMVWVGRRVARAITVKRLSRHKAAPLAYWRRWLVTPVLFGITVWLCTTRLPVYAGFWVSKPWLDRAVAESKSAYPKGLAPRTLGLYARYPAWGIQVQTSRRAETNVALGHSVGLLYRDDGKPPARGTIPGWRARRMSEHWFLIELGIRDEE